MNKRILSFVLSLILLVSLVPATALPASAAELSTSESAITILKQLEGYSKYCSNGYTGYGTLCEKEGNHANHVTSETEADTALRAELKELDKAVNKFAGNLSQSQHDALVLFTFQNGTAWLNGTGDLQTAVKSGAKGEDFLNAICWWNSSTSDDDRRMIEANMYLNGVYSSYVPTRYIRVQFEAGEGKLSTAKHQYFDVANTRNISLVATKNYSTFLGWYTVDGMPVATLDSSDDGLVLYARFQDNDVDPNYSDFFADTNEVYYQISSSKLASTTIYVLPNGDKANQTASGTVTISREYVDANGILWGHIITEDHYEGTKVTWDIGWVRIGTFSVNREDNYNDGTVKYDIDVTVTVTNTYLRVRAEDSIYSKELRKAYLGEQLRIINTSSGDGFLWGQICDNNDDGVHEGWVALMYTNFEEVRGQSEPTVSYNVIGSATIVKPVNGYVNVRSAAGTDNEIVGALPYKTTVDIYEITYVNGIRWARYSGGWFCLSYAEVEGVDLDDYASNTGMLAYAFTGEIIANGSMPTIYSEPNENSEATRVRSLAGDITFTNLTADENGVTWGKIEQGWVMVSDADGYPIHAKLNVAKFYTVVDGVTVRTAPNASAQRVNNLVKGVEFNVNDNPDGKQIVVVGDTVWGYADKVGEGAKTYSGWVNLASKYVARGDAPSAGTSTEDESTGLMATITGADQVNVRIHHDIYSKILGKISRGTTVAILDEDDGWYMIDYDVDSNDETDSWVSGKYVEVTKAAANDSTAGSTGSNGSASVETGLGIVANTYSGVNIRTGVGTGYPTNGKLLPGTTVEILEVASKGTAKWGRVTQGWICMDYVTMIDNYEILNNLQGGNGSSNNSTSTAEVAIYTGAATKAVEIYKTTSLESDVVRTIGAGDPVTVHELLTVTTEETSDPFESGNTSTTITTKVTRYWARVNDGYIHAPATCLAMNALDENVYTVTESESLNVRNAAGTQGTSIVYKLNKGDQVVVTKVQIVNGNFWGFIEADADQTFIVDEDGNKVTEFDWNGEGWISLAYTTKGAITIKTETPPAETQPSGPVLGAGSSVGGYVNNTTGYRYTGKVINVGATPLNVRASASDVAAVVTTLQNGASLVIYETYNDGTYAWGRCDAGWVYLYYVDLTPVVNGAIDARVVFNNNTIAYTDMNCSDVAGTYAKMSVIDIYEIVGKMARTDLGWVNTDNLL